jgi:DNA-binding GntR family transcriptional regulator
MAIAKRASAFRYDCGRVPHDLPDAEESSVTTAKQRAYEKIRKAIFKGSFPPGFHLKEEDLAEYCSASRTPVRQAIRMLASEGLVTIAVNKRCYVSDVSEAHAEEIFDILSFLESYSAGLVAKRITPEALDKLRDIVAEQEALVLKRPDDDRTFLDLNSRFHRTLHRASGNRTLTELIFRIVDFAQSLYLKLGQSTESHSSLRQHKAIVDALAKGDSAHAELMMRVHTESVRREFRELWIGQAD